MRMSRFRQHLKCLILGAIIIMVYINIKGFSLNESFQQIKQPDIGFQNYFHKPEARDRKLWEADAGNDPQNQNAPKLFDKLRYQKYAKYGIDIEQERNPGENIFQKIENDMFQDDTDTTNHLESNPNIIVRDIDPEGNVIRDDNRPKMADLVEEGNDVPNLGQEGNDVAKLGQEGNDVAKLGQERIDEPNLEQEENDVAKLGQEGNDAPNLEQEGNVVPNLGQEGNDVPNLGHEGNYVPNLEKEGNDVPNVEQEGNVPNLGQEGNDVPNLEQEGNVPNLGQEGNVPNLEKEGNDDPNLGQGGNDILKLGQERNDVPNLGQEGNNEMDSESTNNFQSGNMRVKDIAPGVENNHQGEDVMQQQNDERVPRDDNVAANLNKEAVQVNNVAANLNQEMAHVKNLVKDAAEVDKKMNPEPALSRGVTNFTMLVDGLTSEVTEYLRNLALQDGAESADYLTIDLPPDGENQLKVRKEGRKEGRKQ